MGCIITTLAGVGMAIGEWLLWLSPVVGVPAIGLSVGLVYDHKHRHKHGHHHHKKPHHNYKDRPLHKPPSSNFTTIRIFVGSNEKDNEQMAGTLPGVVIFDELGRRIGEVESKSYKTIPGGFRDVLINNRLGLETVQPTYLHLVAGREDICIAAVAVVSPNGSQQIFTGDQMALCPNIARLSPSKTELINTKLESKHCFWLQFPRKYDVTMGGISVHLPDFYMTPERSMAYSEDAKLACARSPRVYPYHARKARTIRDSIFVFNPPLEYTPHTHLDKDPSRILRWATQDRNARDHSDSVVHPYRSLVSARSSNNITAIDADNSIASHNAAQMAREGVYTSIVEGERKRTQPPKLIISDKWISARSQCLAAPWEQHDYLSVNEGVYCDMQTRMMVPVCELLKGGPSTCFNQTSLVLQDFHGPLTTNNIAGHGGHSAQNLWRPTGPLFGYQYTNPLRVD